MPETPTTVEPTQDYLGFVCEKCGKNFAVTGPLDVSKMPREQPLTIGARGPIPADCPHCGHTIEYSIRQLIRFTE